MKLTFNNSWMRLYVRSMGKLFLVENVSESEEEQIALRTSKNLIAVAQVPNTKNRLYLADCYGPARVRWEDSTAGMPFLGMFIVGGFKGEAYELGYISSDVDDVNRFILGNKDVGVIARDNFGSHYVARAAAQPFKKV